jgi:ANTAR domain
VVERGVADAGRPDVVVRRTSAGWTVEVEGAGHPVEELGTALTLADLLTGGAVPGARPPRATGPQDEVERLRASVQQLEHALASRVLVEQAIGVLTERWRVSPRDAFEHLRRVTRSRGLRIHELARTVVDSCTDQEVRLPVELTAPPAGAQTTPPEPRRSPDRPEPESRPRERQRQRGRRRAGTPRPREPYDPPGHRDEPQPRPGFPLSAGVHGPAAVARAARPRPSA